MPDVTVAVCTAGERSTLEGTLRTLASQDAVAAVDYEILVVDNSRDDTGFVRGVVEKVATESSVALRCVREPRHGLGFARNAAIAASQARIVAYVDDDALVHNRWLAELATAYEETGAAAVGGRIDPEWAGQRPRWLGDDLLGYLSILDYGPSLRRCHSPHYPYGANISFRRDVLLEVGGFATALGAGGSATYLMDETELCRRIEASGYAIYYAPGAVVRHIVPSTRLSREFFLNRAAVYGRSTARMAIGPKGQRPSPVSTSKGLAMATGRAVLHAARAVCFLATGKERETVSEERHLVWNLAWMWETASIAVKGA